MEGRQKGCWVASSRVEGWRHGLGGAAVAGGVGYLRRNLEWFASEVRFRTSYTCQ
ncbi:hypothetical protein TIFTF001_046351 [Ficus carica]|uniref:Uncharacterized protein n=1 Tax=Ficus carica TaxID=3494 RepID=A0AA88D7R4_FICCA|nr:hypothetical protein TIFTF001_046351 [Ficus carica]